MCGIAGICRFDNGPEVSLDTLQSMVNLLRHRGPDESGVYLDNIAGLGLNHSTKLISDKEPQRRFSEDYNIIDQIVNTAGQMAFLSALFRLSATWSSGSLCRN